MKNIINNITNVQLNNRKNPPTSRNKYVGPKFDKYKLPTAGLNLNH